MNVYKNMCKLSASESQAALGQVGCRMEAQFHGSCDEVFLVPVNSVACICFNAIVSVATVSDFEFKDGEDVYRLEFLASDEQSLALLISKIDRPC